MSNTAVNYTGSASYPTRHGYLTVSVDDTNIFVNGMDLKHMETAINEELVNISKWLKADKLSLNVKKLTT